MSLAQKLAQERRARLAAERLLELKQAELFDANRKLGQHARKLSDEIVETRAVVETIRGENERVKSDLSLAHQQIEIAERRLWHSIESIQDGFAFFDEESRMIGANPAYVRVFDGLDEVSPGVTYIRLLQLVTEEGIVDIGDQDPASWRAEMLARWQAPSPDPCTVRLWSGESIRLLDQRGPSGDTVSLALDITDTVRYEAALKRARARAEAANRAKSAFLANMSHEIRTPMNGVVGMADLLGETGLDSDQALYVSTIKSSGEALLAIINDVLDYSKIEAEKLELRPAPFDLRQCTADVVMLMQPAAREKGIAVRVDYHPALPTHFVADPGRIRQILTNLVGNAVKFTTKGHVTLRVAPAKAETQDGAVSLDIAVEDTGIGIPADKTAHIFGEFNQVEDERNRAFEGTGLGLAITKRLIRMMQGEISLTSEVGLGSTFRVALRLPVVTDLPARSAEHAARVLATEATAQATDEGTDAPKPGPQKVTEAFNTNVVDPSEAGSAPHRDHAGDMAGAPSDEGHERQMRVLVAEDNKTNRLVFSKMTKALDIDLRFANDGVEAVAAHAEFDPDLIFMDISMPRMDGQEATHRIREIEDGTGRHVPIVALTAHALEGDRDGILAKGLDDYMTKPLRKAELFPRIAAHAPPTVRPPTPGES